MLHKIGQNLIFNSAPCQHFIPSFSVAWEPALLGLSHLFEKAGKAERRAKSRSATSICIRAGPKEPLLMPQPPICVTQGWQGLPWVPRRATAGRPGNIRMPPSNHHQPKQCEASSLQCALTQAAREMRTWYCWLFQQMSDLHGFCFIQNSFVNKNKIQLERSDRS